MDKQNLRKTMLTRRRAITADEQQAASRAVCAGLLAWLADHPEGAVLSYLAYGREIDLAPLHDELWRLGRRLAVPQTAGLPAGVMQAVEYTPQTVLAKTALGVMEPEGALPVQPGEIGVVIAPGVAFDAAGHRLGHGMGYYDRYLAGLNNVAVVGVCYNFQLVDEVPTDRFDRAMDVLITESGQVAKPGA